MKCTKIKFSLLLIVLLAMVFTMACKNESKGDYKPKLYYTIEGDVANPSGTALQNVRVEITDYTMTHSGESKPTDLFATLTDADGAFSIELVSVNKVDKVSLKFSRDGYTPNHLTVGVVQDNTVTISAVLQPRGSYQIIDAKIENTITSGGASVTIGANTLVDAAGALVEGARVSVTPIDTTVDMDLLPGDLFSLVDGSLKLFSTFGMLEIVAIDGKGDPLNLASGATASITIPLGDAAGTNPPLTSSLWYYNEEGAKWELVGNLTLNTEKTAYVGTVSHFSIFNAGKSFDATYIKGSVIDQADNRLYGAEVSIFTELFSNEGIWQANYLTGPEGDFPSILLTDLSGVIPENMAGYLPVPAGTALTVYIKYVNPLNDDVFIARSGKPAPAAEQTDTRKPWELPFVSGAAGATAVYAGEPVVFELATDALVSGTIFFDNDEPGDNLWIVFQEPINAGTYTGMTFAGVDNETGNIVATNSAYANTDDTEIKLKKDTEYRMYIVTRYTGTRLPVTSWFTSDGPPFVVADAVDGEGAVIANTKLFTTRDAGEETIFTIKLPAPGGGGPVVVPNAYVNGIAKLEDGSNAPEGSWAIFTGTVLGSPVIIRSQVGANGAFPDPDGNFPTVEIGGASYVELPAGQKYSVKIVDFTTNPTNPEELFTFDYTSLAENKTETITISAKAKVEGNVRSATTSAPLADKMVRFVETNPPEDEDTEEEGDYLDPDTVTVYTISSGNFPVASLKLNTQYTVTVSDYVTVNNVKSPTNVIWTTYYTSKKDGTVDFLYMPPKPPTVSGTVMYSNGTTPATGRYVQFLIDGGNAAWGGDTIYAQVQANGSYSQGAFNSSFAFVVSNAGFVELAAGKHYAVTVTYQGVTLYTVPGGYTATSAGAGPALNIVMTGVTAP